MSKKYLTMLVLTGLSLGACNLGTSTSDIQNTTVTIGSGTDTVTINSTATDCRTIASGGSCQVFITYSTPSGSSYIDSSISLTSLTGYYSSDFSTNCSTAISTNTNSCSFTYANNGTVSTSTAYSVTYSADGSSSGDAFIVGGGV